MPLGFTRLNEQKQRPNPNINFIKPLEGPHKDVSLDFLSRIAAISAPIMRANHIGVMSLEEFEPNREFWGRNFNAGEVIQLVLKSPSSGRWLLFRFVQMVFMHELAHCKQMNHGRAFWQVRNAYSAELRVLWDKNYTGDGLWGRGQSLYDGQFANEALPAADGEMVRNLCGGTYRGVGGRRKRKAKAEKPQLTYAERKQRRIAKKFGTNGLALGDDEQTRTKLEHGKKVKGKPRVAGSNRGRELRVAALLDRLDKEKAEAVKTEEEDSETEDESDYEELDGQQEAVDAHGQQILDSKGHRLVKVCQSEDHSHDADAQRELEELGQISNLQSKGVEIARESNPTSLTIEQQGSTTASESDEQDDGPEDSAQQSGVTARVLSLKNTNSAKRNSVTLPSSKAVMSHKTPGISSPDSSSSMSLKHADERKPTKLTAPLSVELSNSCPVCSLSNTRDALTCVACAHVLHPDRLPSHWRCTASICNGSLYINAGDSGVCGICGTAKAGFSD